MGWRLFFLGGLSAITGFLTADEKQVLRLAACLLMLRENRAADLDSPFRMFC